MRSLIALAALLALSCCNSPAQPTRKARSPEVIRIWPGQAPGTESWTGAEQAVDAELPNLGKVHIITNVTVPTLTVFRPSGQANGTAMIVVPGGAFRALPWDLDGIETARWLTAHGITAFVLKYRVRPPAGEPNDRSLEDFAGRTQQARDIAVSDAERAIGLVRSHARQFGVAPDKVGMIGFSAGAMTTLSAALTKDPVVRPDFAVSLYGALLSNDPPPADAPPLFIAAAQDDPQLPATESSKIFATWTKANLPAELHIYEKGGHGFGFRPHDVPADRWPDALVAWLSARNYLPH